MRERRALGQALSRPVAGAAPQVAAGNRDGEINRGIAWPVNIRIAPEMSPFDAEPRSTRCSREHARTGRPFRHRRSRANVSGQD